MAMWSDLVRRLTARANGRSGDAEGGLAEGAEARRRREAMQRLQLGVSGVLTMFLLVGLASVIDHRADLADAATVPAAVVEPQASNSQADDDPLVSAGVVPDLPSTPAPAESGPASPAP